MEVQTSILVTLYIMLLGPLKVIGPFALATANADRGLRRQIANRAFALSTIISLVIAVIAGYLMSRLNLSAGTVAVTMGLFLGHWAVGNALAGKSETPPPPDQPKLGLAIFPLTLPAIIPPQGIALLVLSSELQFDSRFGDIHGLVPLMALIVAVMALNWLFMWWAPSLMKFPGPVFWGIVGRVVAVIISATALQIIIRGLRDLGIVA